MDGPGTVLDAAAPVATTSVVVATLPSTGLSMVVTIALGVLAGLTIWGLLYLYHIRSKRAG